MLASLVDWYKLAHGEQGLCFFFSANTKWVLPAVKQL